MRHALLGAGLAVAAAAAAFAAAITGRFDEAIGWITCVVAVVGALSMMVGWDHAHVGNAWAHTFIGVVLLLAGAVAAGCMHLADAFGWAAVPVVGVGVLGIGSLWCGAVADLPMTGR